MSEIIKREDAFNDDGILVINQQDPNYNVLIPTTTIIRQSPYHDVMVTTVQLFQNDYFKVGYDGDSKQNVFALGKLGLFKLMDAAGLQPRGSNQITPSVCQKCQEMARGMGGSSALRCGDCRHESDIAYQATVGIQEPSGQWKEVTETKELDFAALEEDLRIQWEEKAARYTDPATGKVRVKEYSKDVFYDREPYINANVRKEMSQKRRFRTELCETGAYNRAIRMALSIGTYRANEITKPFRVARMYLNIQRLPDEIRTAMLRQSTAVLERNRHLLGRDDEESLDLLPAPEDEHLIDKAQAEHLEEVVEDNDLDYGDESPETGKAVEPETDELVDLAETVLEETQAPEHPCSRIREQLHLALAANTSPKREFPATRNQTGTLAMLINQATGLKGLDGDQPRHTFLDWLWGKQSTADLTFGEALVTLDWLIDHEKSKQGVSIFARPNAAEVVCEVVNVAQKELIPA